MPDLSRIPLWELRNDLRETEEDIAVCETALKLGIETYSKGKSVKERLDMERRIREVVLAELTRRGESQ